MDNNKKWNGLVKYYNASLVVLLIVFILALGYIFNYVT